MTQCEEWVFRLAMSAIFYAKPEMTFDTSGPSFTAARCSDAVCNVRALLLDSVTPTQKKEADLTPGAS